MLAVPSCRLKRCATLTAILIRSGVGALQGSADHPELFGALPRGARAGYARQHSGLVSAWPGRIFRRPACQYTGGGRRREEAEASA